MSGCLRSSCVVILLLVGWSANSAEPFDYFANNWNVVGLKDYERGARVTPDNQILLAGAQSAIQVRFGQKLAPLSRQHGKLAHDGWMPIMEIAASDEPVRYEFTYWATPLPTVKDWKKAFDWPTEGENFLVWVQYKAVNQSGKPAVARIDIGPNPKAAPRPSVEAPNEPAVDASLWRPVTITRELAAGESIAGAARFAFFPVKDAASLEAADYQLWLQRTVDYWRGLEKTIAAIRTPCRKATETLKAAHVCQMIANDHGEVRGGEGFYDNFYIRDGAYQVMELEEAGMWDAARKSIELFLPRQRTDGRFESQKDEYDGNGQALWALWQYHKITGDREFLARVYPAMRRGAEWTMKARRQTGDGILPSGIADGEKLWDGKHHIVGYDFWNRRGLLCAADAAQILGKTADAEELTKEAESYRQAIEAAWKRTGLKHFPPSWEKDGTHWGNTETLWPTPLLASNDERVAALGKFVRHEFAGGFIEDTIQWVGMDEPVIHPYMGAYTTMADMICGNDQQVVEDFYWYLLHSTAAHAFPEGIFPKRRYAWSETIPHVTGACNYAILLRHILVHEQGDELHLLSAVPDWWLGEGQEIRIERLPTHFGEMSLTIRGNAQGVEAAWTKPSRQRPSKIVLHLPSNRPLLKPLEGVAVVTRPPQAVRWDFPTVVNLYQKTHGAAKSAEQTPAAASSK
jgi:hypothetical protein